MQGWICCESLCMHIRASYMSQTAAEHVLYRYESVLRQKEISHAIGDELDVQACPNAAWSMQARGLVR